jgi:hypothetical protein
MDAHPDYTAAWRDFRKRRLIFWITCLGGVLGVFVLFIGIGLPIAALIGINAEDYFFFPLAAAWMLASVITSLRVSWFGCPRCGQWFFSTWWYHNPLARKCAHCGLPKWATSADP